MQGLIIAIALLVMFVLVVIVLLSFGLGYYRGTKEMYEINMKYKSDFEKIIVDYITGHYERRE